MSIEDCKVATPESGLGDMIRKLNASADRMCSILFSGNNISEPKAEQGNKLSYYMIELEELEGKLLEVEKQLNRL